MMRQFLDTFKSKQRFLPRRLRKKLNVTLVTGVSAFRLIKQIIDERLNSIPGLRIQPVAVKNDFFGHNVTVTGLLTGADILNTLRKRENLDEVVLLPPNCVNQDGLFLDDSTPEDLEKELDRRVVVGSNGLVESLVRVFD